MKGHGDFTDACCVCLGLSMTLETSDGSVVILHSPQHYRCEVCFSQLPCIYCPIVSNKPVIQPTEALYST